MYIYILYKYIHFVIIIIFLVKTWIVLINTTKCLILIILI